MGVTDAELVRAVVEGSREAYAELVRRYGRRIAAICWSRLGRRGPVDDMVQETFLRGFRGIRTLVDPSRFGSWLHGIAIRACQDWLKAKGRTEVPFGELSEEPSVEGRRERGAEPDPEQTERQGLVLDEVEALPEIYRDVIVLFYFDRRPYNEMARMLGVTPAAINARLTKARKILRRRLSKVVEP